MPRTKRVWIVAALVAALPVVAVACGPDADVAPSPEVGVVTDTVGDTIVVRTLTGSVWGADATLEPEVSIGELDGPEEHLFGEVGSIAVDDDRNVYVLDEQAQEVRVFDAQGVHVRRLAQRGQGPGELTWADAIALLPDGRLVVRDGDRRMHLLDPGTGGREEWNQEGGWAFPYGSHRLWTDAAGRIHTLRLDLRLGMEGSLTGKGRIIIVLGPDGTPLDTLPPPDIGFDYALLRTSNSSARVPFSPLVAWVGHPHGGFVSGLSTDYRIDVPFEEGILRIERAYDPIPVSPGEREHFRASLEEEMRYRDPDWRWNAPPIPETKPVFTSLHIGRDGRIWVKLSAEAEAVENDDYDPEDSSSMPKSWTYPRRFDVFEPDGSYLGAVSAPEDFLPFPNPIFNGDHVWGVTRDDLGVERVVRYRIVRGSSVEASPRRGAKPLRTPSP